MSSGCPISVCIALLALAAPAAADTHKVPKEFATIGEAVVAAQPGDTILVSKGTYLEQVTVGVADLKLVGKQAVIDAEYAGPCLDIQADGVSVSGFKLVNGTNGLLANGTDISVSRCEVSNCGLNGMALSGGAFTVSRNTVTTCGQNGIAYTRSEPGDTLIDRNVCLQCTQDGIIANGDGITLTRNRCERNLGRGLFANVLALPGDGAPSSAPVVVEKNTCSVNDIGVNVTNGTSAAVTVSKNRCSGNAFRGMIVDGLNAVVTGNVCEDNRDEGLLLLTTGALVEKNVCSNNRRYGIASSSSVAVADGGFGDGSDNQLSANTCKGNGGDGIAVFAGTGNVLDGNKCTGNGDDGIDLEETAITGATLSGNTCSDNGHEGIDNAGQLTILTGNVCKHNGAGIGPDIAGLGDGGLGTVFSFAGNTFDTGGEEEPSRLDNFVPTGP